MRSISASYSRLFDFDISRPLDAAGIADNVRSWIWSALSRRPHDKCDRRRFFRRSAVKPSFLRTTAVKKPRTECGCQPVDLDDSCYRRAFRLSVAGRGRFPVWSLVGWKTMGAVLGFGEVFRPGLGCQTFRLPGCFTVRHSRISFRVRRTGAVTTEAPHGRNASGARSREGQAAICTTTLTLHSE